MKDSLRTLEGRKNYLSARSRRLKVLNDNARYLDDIRVKDCISKIIKGYEEATNIKYMSRISKEAFIEDYRFKSIGIHLPIKKDEFLAENFIWDSYFAAVGRAIAEGELKYLHRKVRLFVEQYEESMCYEKLDFHVISGGIRKLQKNNVEPNVLLLPMRVYREFLTHYASELKWNNGRNPKLVMYGCELNVFLSSKYAPLKSIVIFDSKASEWHVLKDENTYGNIAVAIGMSDKQNGKVEYYAETLAYYKVLNKKAYPLRQGS